MSRRALWAIFVLVHVAVAAAGHVLPNEPMGDVYRVYEPWSQAAVSGGSAVGITEDWVYPQLALIPMVLAGAFSWVAGYTIAWAGLVAALNAVAFAVLVGTGRSVGRVYAALFWMAAVALLGPVGMYRLDAVTVPLAICGCLWLLARPWAAAALLAVATWMKVWPAALLAAAFVSVRRRGVIVGGAAVVTALTVALVLVAGGGAHLFGFIADQSTRGLQVEAPVSLPYLWGALLGIPGYAVEYSYVILTFEVTGAGTEIVAAAMTPLLAVAAIAICAVGAVKAWRGARFVSLFPVLAFALVLALLMFNKVGSPQFQTWLFTPVIIGLVLSRRRWRGGALAVLLSAGLTQLVYPVLYHGILDPQWGPVLLLSARNVLLLVLFVGSLIALARVPVRARVLTV